MNIAIIGASGFLGKNLIKHLLNNTEYNIKAISPNSNRIYIEEKFKNRVQKIQANVFDYENIKKALMETDIVFYFVHMMAIEKKDFQNEESDAAHIVSKAILNSKVKRIIYMSGLGDDNDNLSKHLISRHKTGDILREYNNEVIELRASMIIGPGSISFEIVRNIVNKSPIITLPKWSKTLTQPIGLNDALLYLQSSIKVHIDKSEIIEIGGPEMMSYKEFVKKYAKYIKKNIFIIRLPFLNEKMAGFFLNFFNTKEQARVGKCMLSSFRNEMIVRNKNSKNIFPDIIPLKIENYFE